MMSEYHPHMNDALPPELSEALTTCCGALIDGAYSDALQIFNQALKDVFTSQVAMNGHILAGEILLLLETLKENLQETSGEQDWIVHLGIPQQPPHEKSQLQCSFCGAPQHEVHKLIAGPAVYICDVCVQRC